MQIPLSFNTCGDSAISQIQQALSNVKKRPKHKDFHSKSGFYQQPTLTHIYEYDNDYSKDLADFVPQRLREKGIL